MSERDAVVRQIDESQRVVAALKEDEAVLASLAWTAAACVSTFRSGGKVLLAGNGGSAAQAQHLAAELVGRFAFDRDALPAVALSTDTSVLTSIGNDYGFDHLFARQVRAHGRAGDVLIVFSTSGASPNVVRACEEARSRGLVRVAFTGRAGEALPPLCDRILRVPSAETPRIQEAHLMLGHILCGIIERDLFAPGPR